MPERDNEQTPFARFGLAVGPWVDVEVLQERHRELMAHCHPDSKTGAAEKRAVEGLAACLNEDVALLRDPVRRLEWMLGQEGLPAKSGVPAEGEALFLPLGRWMREVDGLKRSLQGRGVLERALLAKEAAQLVIEGNRLAVIVTQGRRQVETELRELGRMWPEHPDWETLRGLHVRLVYLQKWGRDLGERQFLLAGMLG